MARDVAAWAAVAEAQKKKLMAIYKPESHKAYKPPSDSATSLRYQNAIMENISFVSGNGLRSAIADIAARSDLVVFGEKHSMAMHRVLLRKSLRGIGKSGAKSLAVEFLPSDMQPLLDSFGRRERRLIMAQLDLGWEKYGKSSARAIFGLINEAKRRGIRVVAMDKPRPAANALTVGGDRRDREKEGHMRGIMAKCLESGKTIALCGKEHAMRIAGPFRAGHATSVVEFIGERPPDQKRDLFASAISGPGLGERWFIMRGPKGMERNRFNGEMEFPDWIIHIPEKH